jgi:flavin-dependent dehydrogenase
MANVYDIAIVGAGPAGAATARRLAQRGCRVALLERSRFDTPRVGESLAPGVQPLLADLGVWPQFLDLHPLPSYGTRSVWGAATAEEHSHMLTPYLCGWHVDRLAFDRMLADSAAKAGAQLMLGVRVLRCAPSPNGGVILQVGEVKDSARLDEIRADFVVDAGGRVGALARSFGSRYATFDRLVGVGAQFNDALAGAHCYTLVETTPDGWWYSAPVATDRSVAMLMTDGDLSASLGAKAWPQWRAALRRAKLTSERVGVGKPHWGPRIFSAASRRLVRAAGDRARWLAVGDAALSVDPISGSGVIRALRTAQDAASTVLATLTGASEAIAGYEAERDKECSAYLVERAAYYSIERRWPSAPFWRRRVAVLERHLRAASSHAAAG